MVLVYFACLNPQGEFNQLSYGGPDMEACFDTLNHLTINGWHLISVDLVALPNNNRVSLPIEAFTGEPMRKSLAQLQQSWEQTLTQVHGSVKGRKQFVYGLQQALVSQELAQQHQLQIRSRTEELFKRMDAIQAGIQQTKLDWGVE